MALAGLLAMLGAAAYPAAGELPAQKSPATAKAAGRAHAIDLPASAAMAAVPNSSQDLDSRLKELEATQKALYSSWLDGQRKTIDWWLAFLAIMMGVLALAGVAIPYLMGRKDKELMNQLLSDAKQAVTDAQQQLNNIKTAAVEVEQHTERVRADAASLAAVHAQSATDVVAYNLACCFALKGDVPESLKWLECSAKAGTLPLKLTIQTDKDFDGIRDDSRFSAWFNKLEK